MKIKKYRCSCPHERPFLYKMSKNSNSTNSLGDLLSDLQRNQLGAKKASPKIPNPIYIKTFEELEKAALKWNKCNQIAIDTEFDDNNNYYGRHLCLVQIYDKDKIYLIDTVKLEGNINPLLAVLENPNVEKIFHSCSSDLIVVGDVCNCAIKNIQDTALMYRFLLKSHNDIGLQSLVEEKLNIELEKQEQVSDWAKRPLSKSQLIYAATDVIYLFELFEILKKELQELERWNWYKEEREKLEEIGEESTNNKSDSENKKVIAALKTAIKYKLPEEQNVRFALYWNLRDEVAKRVNRPHYRVISNNLLADLVQRPPKKLEEWQNLRGSSHHFKKRADEFFTLSKVDLSQRKNIFFQELDRRAEEKEEYFHEKRQHQRTLHQREIIFTNLREALTDYNGLNMQSLILSNKNKNDVLWNGIESVTNSWKMEVLENIAKQNEWNIDVLKGQLKN
ncbi:ribonuclease D [Bernardetia litoralis DSM 6794]|uniref:Ribonuclease D n=2 Tax=Bernardetia litoralis TaxID=999 RepID=I4AJA3_BERLS|nr:ribonuclease D [Bernardetia litoralis DSM 6794]